MTLTPSFIVACDIDGTLLTRERNQVSLLTRLAIEQAQEAGHILVLATSRCEVNTRPLAELLKVNHLILYDGAVALVDGQVVHRHPLSKELINKVANMLLQQCIQPVVQYHDGQHEEIWVGPEAYDNEELSSYLATYPDQVRRMHHAQLGNGSGLLRIAAFIPQSKLEDVQQSLNDIDCTITVHERSSYGEFAEVLITAEGVSKGAALQHITDQRGVREMIAIGDGENDISMFNVAQVSVAMGNAPEAVKKAAQYVTTSVGNSGVAWAIFWLVLQRKVVLFCVGNAGGSGKSTFATYVRKLVEKCFPKLIRHSYEPCPDCNDFFILKDWFDNEVPGFTANPDGGFNAIPEVLEKALYKLAEQIRVADAPIVTAEFVRSPGEYQRALEIFAEELPPTYLGLYVYAYADLETCYERVCQRLQDPRMKDAHTTFSKERFLRDYGENSPDLMLEMGSSAGVPVLCIDNNGIGEAVLSATAELLVGSFFGFKDF